VYSSVLVVPVNAAPVRTLSTRAIAVSGGESRVAEPLFERRPVVAPKTTKIPTGHRTRARTTNLSKIKPFGRKPNIPNAKTFSKNFEITTNRSLRGTLKRRYPLHFFPFASRKHPEKRLIRKTLSNYYEPSATSFRRSLLLFREHTRARAYYSQIYIRTRT